MLESEHSFSVRRLLLTYVTYEERAVRSKNDLITSCGRTQIFLRNRYLQVFFSLRLDHTFDHRVGLCV